METEEIVRIIESNLNASNADLAELTGLSINKAAVLRLMIKKKNNPT